MKRSVLASVLIIFLLIPATLFLGTRLTGRMYYLTCTLMIIEMMLPFFLVFETRKPQARELVTLAVLCALAVASRVVFVLPNFKPIIGIVMIAGIALGPEAGFMTGAISAFASNFFFSQGPWTPWQMMAYGIGGFLAGIVFRRCKKIHPLRLGLFGFVSVMVLVGPLLDACMIFTTASTITWEYVLAVLSMGLWHNLQHAAACAATVMLLGPPLLKKIGRLKKKYGMMDTEKLSGQKDVSI
ncbi:MAG: ECF transporter S component [Oscillospiraceae bacterium]|nr:ECF transporter S component [Oscillospiraceae bacterium]